MKAVFLRALEGNADKDRALREAIASPERSMGRTRFDVDHSTFGHMPRSPFAYWVSDRVRAIFAELPAFESEGRIAKQGLVTADDFRFVRLWTEAHCGSIGRRWFPFAKGGKLSPFYADITTLVGYSRGDQVGLQAIGRYGRGATYYFRPGLTWPARPHKRGAFAIVPEGAIFSHTGTMIFEDSAEGLLATCAVLNSNAYIGLLHLLMPRGTGEGGQTLKYEVGYVVSIPLPPLTEQQAAEFAESTVRSWHLRQSLDTQAEISHAFELPALLRKKVGSLAARSEAWVQHVAEIEAEVGRLRAGIDGCCFELYGIEGPDREQIECGLDGGSDGDDTAKANDDRDEDDEAAELDAAPLVASLLSWSIGVAFGRYDLCLATGERPAVPEPEPFDPLPVCSPAMLTGEDGLPLDAPPAGYAVDFPRDGILVDDAGADRDLVAAARQIFEPIFDDPAARWEEAADILADRDRALRGWFAREFFELHIKRYSKSRRKAPLYWQLATHLASYSAWLYYHRFTRDTLFRLLNDHVAPKLQHEERKLTNLTQDAGPNPTASQRKEIDAQETLVGELRAFRVEVAMVAPLWNPNLNDGVILNFAPLWRLVPQHKAWQKECKSAWDKLCKGDYDWAHLAMHLWPERVVPKCGKDRSLAIAHGLEEVFWREDEDGKWQPKTISDEEVAGLVAERTSPAVKAALKSLQEAPAPTAGRARAPRRKKTTTRRAKSATPATAPAESRERPPRQAASTRAVDPAVLEQIRSAIATLGSNAAKSDILDTAGLSASQWTPAINALLADGSVTKTGQKRGTRYHLAQNPS